MVDFKGKKDGLNYFTQLYHARKKCLGLKTTFDTLQISRKTWT